MNLLNETKDVTLKKEQKKDSETPADLSVKQKTYDPEDSMSTAKEKDIPKQKPSSPEDSKASDVANHVHSEELNDNDSIKDTL